MTVEYFLILLLSFSVLSGLITEGIKKIISDKKNISYNIIALISSIVVGGLGTCIFYQLNEIDFTVNNIIYIVLMGLASGLVSMVGYDKVKQSILQFTGIK